MYTPISDFKELRIYKQAFESAMNIFRMSKAWPQHEQYALTDQIRRSSRSICSAIGEAWFKRRYPRHFISKLSDASSEAAETLIWLDFARACGYIDVQTANTLEETYREVLGGLTKMMSQPEKWCISSSVHEDEVPFTLDNSLNL